MIRSRVWFIELLERTMRAAILDASLYDEAEGDPTYAEQALVVVLLTGLAAGIGGAARGPVSLIVAALAGWYGWAVVTFWIGSKLLPGRDARADTGLFLDMVGFASAPGIIRLVGILPGLTSLAFAFAQLWMLVATVIAVRRALGYASTGRAAAATVIGWLIYTIVMLALVDIWRA